MNLTDWNYTGGSIFPPRMSQNMFGWFVDEDNHLAGWLQLKSRSCLSKHYSMEVSTVSKRQRAKKKESIEMVLGEKSV